MQRNLHNQVTLITGASAGIGRATARVFAERGASLVLASRRASALDEVRDELSCYRVPVVVVPADIGDDGDLQNLVSQAKQSFGRIDILVNNAGVCKGGLCHEMDPEILSEILQVNLHGTLRLTQLVLPMMMEQGGGQIVNVCSLSAKFYIPGVSVYSATKAGILAFSDTLRREVQRQGIFVSNIVAGPTQTGMIANAVEEVFRLNGNHHSGWLKRLVRVMDEPENVARAILMAVLHRRRQVVTGGWYVRLLSTLEITTPRLLDHTLSWIDMDKIDAVTGQLGKE
jgi:short-subunit dehydrogenase